MKKSEIQDAINYIGSAFPIFGNQLAGSSYWLETKQTYSIVADTSTHEQLIFKYRDFDKQHGVILPETRITQKDILKGNKEIILDYYKDASLTKPTFSVHLHTGIHNDLHIQNGNKIIHLPYDQQFTTLGQIGSSVFLQTQNKEEIFNAINKILN